MLYKIKDIKQVHMTLGERIKAFRKHKRWSQEDLAAKLGVANNTISNWEKDLRPPPMPKLKKLAEVFGLSHSELLDESNELEITDINSDLGDIVQVTEYQMRVSAGGGVVITDDQNSQKWPFPRAFFDTVIRANPETCGVFEVHGDSMEPTLRSGDRIIVNFEKTNPARPGLFVIAHMGEALVKRVELLIGSNPPKVRISSDNPNHASYEEELENVQIVGWVDFRFTKI